MRRRAPVLLLLLVLVVSLPSTTAPVRAQDETANKTDRLVDLINHARVQAGLLPLARSTELDQAAQLHSTDMVQHDYLDHTGSDGSQPQERAEGAGFHVPANSGWIVVEVISAISGDPQGPADWWMGDDQHQRVLMNPRWREIGAGYAQGGNYGNYWTALFGCRPGVLPTVTLDGIAYTHTEECGDPSVAAAVAPTPTAQPTPTLVRTIPTPTNVPAPSPAVSTSVSVAQSGNALSVTWSGIAQPSATDWFGVYHPPDADAAYQEWDYVNCTKSPDQPRVSGNCTLALPTASGNYEIRMFSNNGYARLGRSQVVVRAAAPVTLTVNPDMASAGSDVNVQWRGIVSPSSTDWFGLYRPGDPDTVPLEWLYVGCAQQPLDARPLGSCNLSLPKTLGSGEFELRLLAANAYSRLATPVSLRIS